MRSGWGQILNLNSRRTTTKFHYFKEGTSLCGKYMLEGGDGFLQINDGKNPLKDKGCKECSELIKEEKK